MNIDDIHTFSELICSNNKIPFNHYLFNINLIPWSIVFLVCVHATRDNRCGEKGPQLINNLRGDLYISHLMISLSLIKLSIYSSRCN